MLEQTLQQLYQGKINPLQAVYLADEDIEGITAAFLKKSLTLQNHRNRFPVNIKNLNRSQIKLAVEFIVLAYWFAQSQGNIHPGEIHLSDYISSKHHKKGLVDYIQGLLNKYWRQN